MEDQNTVVPLLHKSFKALCIVTTTFMVGFWICKYSSNEDITRIEYKPLRNGETVVFPEFTICFGDPLLNDKLHEIDAKLDKRDYLEYLRGNKGDSNQTFAKIDYERITFDLFEYLHRIRIASISGSNLINQECTNATNCDIINLKNSYNGFDMMQFLFLRCFGMEINRNYLGDVFGMNVGFKKTLKDILIELDQIFLTFNYPGQLRLKTRASKPIWKNVDENEALETFEIKHYEITRKRNKRSNPCYDGPVQYDHSLLKQQIEKVGCRTPYQQNDKQFPLCDKQMKDSAFLMNAEIENVFQPCQQTSYLAFDHINFSAGNITWNETFGFYPLNIMFPDQVKEIEYLQAIDIHSLIGNIGGYIGLFLGKAFTKFRILNIMGII